MKNFLVFGLFLTAIFTTFSCKKNAEWSKGDTGPMSLDLDTRWIDHNLSLGAEETTPNGEKVILTTLNYFVSNFVLTNEDGTKYIVPQNECYFLTREDSSETQNIELKNIPAGNYTGVSFTIGVDSARSAADISLRAGALDVGGAAADMYWTWNSGYIFYKIEGTSPVAPFNAQLGGNYWWYHMGGFGGYDTKTFNNLKTVTLTADKSDAEHQAAEVRTDRAPEWHVYVDISKFFAGTTTLKIAEYQSVMFDPFSTEICKNFPAMFSVNHVHND
jgi:hypothetical protein